MIQYPNYSYPPYNQMQSNGYMMQPQAQVQNQSPNQMPIQNGGFVSAPNENYVINYPIAHGNCITFKIDGKPVVMEKSLGFSQFESPVVKRYRLIEEDAEQAQEDTSNDASGNFIDESIKADIEALKTDIDSLKKQVKNIQATKNKKLVKQIIEEEDEDDAE